MAKPKYNLWIAILLLVCACGAAERPNIIFILADDMGIGDARCYNPESKIITPNIDRLAEEGMRFTDAHSAGALCVPTRYGLLTGRYAFRTWPSGIEARLPNLHTPQPTIASVLKSGGYDTAMVGKWHLGLQYQSDGTIRYSPIEYGFDYFFGRPASQGEPAYYYAEDDRVVEMPAEWMDGSPTGDPTKVSNPNMQGAIWAEGPMAPSFDLEQTLPILTNKAVDYINTRSANDKPFFLYFAMTAPHTPWLPLPEFQGTSGAGDYGDFMVQVDHSVSQVLAALEQQGLVEKTLVIFGSDNGAVWYSGDIDRYGHRASGIYRGMKGALYEGGHRMPFVARWPARIRPGSVSDHLTNFTDMMTTFADIAGVDVPAGAGPDSFSILPALLEETATGAVRADMVHENYGAATLAYREGDWKLILPNKVYGIGAGAIVPNTIIDIKDLQLYNLANDPSETTNLISVNPDKAIELFDKLVNNIEQGASR